MPRKPHLPQISDAIIVLAFIVSLFLYGCSDDRASFSNDVGILSVEFGIDNSLRSPEGVVLSVGAFMPDMDDVSVTMKSVNGAYSHTWDSSADFPVSDRYLAGGYEISAVYGYQSEGFESPCYFGSVRTVVAADRSTESKLVMALVSVAVKVDFAPEFLSGFSDVRAYVHSDGGGYFCLQPSDSRLLYVNPGKLSLYLSFSMPDGRDVCFRCAEVDKAESGKLYDCGISLLDGEEAPRICCMVAGKKFEFELSDSFLSSEPPVIYADGWEDNATLILPEGDDPSRPLVANIGSCSSLRHVYLSVKSAYLQDGGFPCQVDMLALTEAEAEILRSFGLVWSGDLENMDIDFSAVLGRLVYLSPSQALSSFGLIAEDEAGRFSSPVVLMVQTTPVEISVERVENVVVGAPEAEIVVAAQATDFASHVAIEIEKNSGWVMTDINSIVGLNDGTYSIRFAIPDGNAKIKARIRYCEEIRAEFSVGRLMPEFGLEVDPFASYAIVKVTAVDDEAKAYITKNLFLYVDGKRGSVLSRNTDKGTIALTGLRPNTSYVLTSTMMDRPSENDFTTGRKFSTERAPQMPNPDFEERRDGISYSQMPSGGRYSQNTVAIFNWQNRWDFSLQEPKSWANTNAKTFNRRAKNHNTWYMQPSVFTDRTDVQSGEFAICLRSVAFDLSGEDITDYVQTGQPYLKYSPVIPHISYRAAGKLFLGGYSFDPVTLKEEYRDVVDWGSRPSSMSGFYKYSPSDDDPSDAGVALVEVYGTIDGHRSVIASGRTYLPIANGYTAFNVPLSYECFGVKATGIKVMFASSHSIGSITEESGMIVTTPDPVTASSIGSVLKIDNINFAY